MLHVIVVLASDPGRILWFICTMVFRPSNSCILRVFCVFIFRILLGWDLCFAYLLFLIFKNFCKQFNDWKPCVWIWLFIVLRKHLYTNWKLENPRVKIYCSLFLNTSVKELNWNPYCQIEVLYMELLNWVFGSEK